MTTAVDDAALAGACCPSTISLGLKEDRMKIACAEFWTTRVTRTAMRTVSSRVDGALLIFFFPPVRKQVDKKY